MAYEKQNFLDGQIVTADHLNHIENGIVAAQNPRNLLDNSYFRNPVNQRGARSYSGSVYSIDRWKLWTTETTLTINDGYITNAEREMVQLLESVDTSKTYTLAGCTYDGVIHILQGKFDGNNYVDDYLRFVGDSSVYCVGLKPNSWVWAALYEGAYTADTLPEYVPKGYAAELAECQRYYQRFAFDLSKIGVNATNGYPERIPVRLSVPMRIVPTVTLNKSWSGALSDAATTEYITKDGFCFTITATATSAYAEWHGKIACSADL